MAVNILRKMGGSFASFRKKEEPVPDLSQRLLVAPREWSPDEVPEYLTARELLGINTAPGRTGPALIVGFKPVKALKKARADRISRSEFQSDSVVRCVAVHRGSIEKSRTLDWLFMLRKYPDMTLLVQSVRHSPRTFLQHIAEQRVNSNEARSEYLADVLEYALPQGERELQSHSLIMWGPSDAMIQIGSEKTAALGGHIVLREELGPLIRQVIEGEEIDLTRQPADRINGFVDSVTYAAPTYIKWGPDYVELPQVQVVYAYWNVVILKPEILAKLIKLGDVLIRAEKVYHEEQVPKPGQTPSKGKKVETERRGIESIYFSATLRVRRDPNQLADFVNIGRELATYSKSERWYGADLETVFRAFVPGSPPPPAKFRHYVPKAIATLGVIAESLVMVNASAGSMVLGRARPGMPQLWNPVENPAFLVTGQTNSGKNTLVSFMAGQFRNAAVLYIPFTSAPGESMTQWVADFGGTVIELPDLRDAPTLADDKQMRESSELSTAPSVLKEPSKTAEELVQWQMQLVEQDRHIAADIVNKVFSRFEQKGTLSGMPIVISSTCGDTVRVMRVYYELLKVWLESWEKWIKHHDDRMILLFNDFYSLTKQPEDDPILGAMPSRAARELARRALWYVSNGKNRNILTWVMTQDPEDLSWADTSVYNHFNLHLKLTFDDKIGDRTASLVQPHRNEPLVNGLDVKLPTALENRFGRIKNSFSR